MFPSWLHQLARRSFSPLPRPRRQPLRFRPRLERLEERTVPAELFVTSNFGGGQGSGIVMQVAANESGTIIVESFNDLISGTEFLFQDTGAPLTLDSNTSNFFSQGANQIEGNDSGFAAPVDFEVDLDGGNHTVDVIQTGVGRWSLDP